MKVPQLVFAAIAALLLVATAHGAPPQTIAYQGTLTSNTGVPVTGSQNIVFAIYSAASGGTALWSETQSVLVTNGNYQVILGNSTPIALPFDAPYWLGVRVGADAEMAPRAALASVPYAFRASNADSAVTVSGTIPGSQITGSIASATLSGATLTQLDGRYAQPTVAAAPIANIKSNLDQGSGAYLTKNYTSITIGADGMPVMSFVDSDGLLKVLRCGNSACSTGNTTSVIYTPAILGEHIRNSITIAPDGRPVVAYTDGPGGLKVVKCGNAACSSGNVATFAGSLGASPSIAIGADGLPLISVGAPSAGFASVVKCAADGCTTGGTGVAQSVAGNYSSIAIGFDGMPVIAYVVPEGSTLKGTLVRCADLTCAGVGYTPTEPNGRTVYPLPQVSNSGGLEADASPLSMAIGADAVPVIVLGGFGHTTVTTGADTFDGSLRVVKCSTPRCIAAPSDVNPDYAVAIIETTLASSAIPVGQHNSIAIGLDGLPVISYYAARNSGSTLGDLKVVKCGNAACSAGNLISTLDTATKGNFGKYNSITIGADGAPIIAYFDTGNGILKTIKCANAFCSPYFRRR